MKSGISSWGCWAGEEVVASLARLGHSGSHPHYRPGQEVLCPSTITIKKEGSFFSSSSQVLCPSTITIKKEPSPPKIKNTKDKSFPSIQRKFQPNFSRYFNIWFMSWTKLTTPFIVYLFFRITQEELTIDIMESLNCTSRWIEIVY